MNMIATVICSPLIILAASMRYEDGREVKTTYEYDLYGNQIVSSSTDSVKMMTYNDKNR